MNFAFREQLDIQNNKSISARVLLRCGILGGNTLSVLVQRIVCFHATRNLLVGMPDLMFIHKGAVNLSHWADRQANGLFAHPRSNVIS